MLTFKPFTTLLNITLINLHYALRQTRYVDVDVEPYAVNRLCLSMRNVRDYDPVEDYHRVATYGSLKSNTHDELNFKMQYFNDPARGRHCTGINILANGECAGSFLP